MKLTILTSLLFSLTLTSALCAGEPTTKEPDPFDITAIQKRIEEVGVPTPAIVQQLEAKATALAKDSKWQDAADAYDALAKNANSLANFVHTGIAPVYKASSGNRYNLKEAVKLENQSNDYKTKRNAAMVAQAECYIRLNDTKRAMSLLIRALELINVNEAELWARARKDLYRIVQITDVRAEFVEAIRNN
jgi:tetratricopeptide (TPR) repeat protein